MSDELKPTAVCVCPWRDIECGRNWATWCAECPQWKMVGRRATPSPSTAPTEQNQVADLNVMPPLPEPDHSLDCGMQPFYRPDQMYSYARTALASKPAAREAARQSIDTPKFRDLLMLTHHFFVQGDPANRNHAERCLIAHIDTWGGAAPTVGNQKPVAYLSKYVIDALRDGCTVAATLTPTPNQQNTEPLYVK